MDHRVGELHVQCSVRGDVAMAAQLPTLERALCQQLALALGAGLDAAFGQDAAVLVVRELHGSAVLPAGEAVSDVGLVELVCMSTLQAMERLLRQPAAAGVVMRFEDEAAFTGSFIADLLAGVAWDRWYYGAFRRFREADTATTIRAVLAGAGVPLPRVLAWLSQRGLLPALLECVPPAEVLRWVGPDAHGGDTPGGAHGGVLLAQAALQLLAVLVPAVSHPSSAQLLDVCQACEPLWPDWRDRRSLTACVAALVKQGLERLSPSAWPLRSDGLQAAQNLLDGTLDWLDGPWLMGWITQATAAGTAAPVLSNPDWAASPRHEGRVDALLRALALEVRGGRVALPVDDGDSQALHVALIAAAARHAPGRTGPEPAVLQAVAEVVRALRLGGAGGAPAEVVPGPGVDRAHAPMPPEAYGSVPPSPAASPGPIAGRGATRRLLEALQAVRPAAVPARDTRAAGLYLLARAVNDLRLPALARECDVALAPLLAGLAVKWLGQPLPQDEAGMLWSGGAWPGLEALEDVVDALGRLNARLAQALGACPGGRRAGSDGLEEDARQLDAPLPGAPRAQVEVARTACLLLRGWARWLRGVADSSPAYLLERTVRRVGRARLTRERIALELEPAPFDAVLHMAAYFESIESVPWLGGRRIDFTVRDAPPERRA